MQVLPIQLNNIKNIYNPSFRSYSRRIVDNDYPYYTTTEFFRPDLNWEDFVHYIDNEYKNADKVNIICHACSNGEEPYSLAMLLNHRFKNKADKYFPIIAKDLNIENISLARKGDYTLNSDDVSAIRRYAGRNKLRDYFYILGSDIIYTYARIKKPIKDKVIFNYADIRDDVENIPPKNTVLMCRNFWPYLSSKDRKILAQRLYTQLDKSSMLVLGNFDMYGCAVDAIKKAGFVETELYGIFRKKSQKHSNKSTPNTMLNSFTKKLHKLTKI